MFSSFHGWQSSWNAFLSWCVGFNYLLTADVPPVHHTIRTENASSYDVRNVEIHIRSFVFSFKNGILINVHICDIFWRPSPCLMYRLLTYFHHFSISKCYILLRIFLRTKRRKVNFDSQIFKKLKLERASYALCQENICEYTLYERLIPFNTFWRIKTFAMLFLIRDGHI